MHIFAWLLQIGLCVLLIGSAGVKWGSIPALGPFFSPFEGFWRQAEPLGERPRKVQDIAGLDHTVEIAQDRRGVPHLFAKSERDLYVAQGYLTARDRLWQMDIVTREAGGRLAEVLGPKLVDHDLLRRRHGMLLAAQSMAGAMEKHDGTRQAVEAYCQGVNAYLAQLKPKDWPLEFKLLGYAPEPWTRLKTALLIASMQWTLSAGKQDQPLTATLGKYGPLFFKKFFPAHDSEEIPIIPPGTRWSFLPEAGSLPQDSLGIGDSLVPPQPGQSWIPSTLKKGLASKSALPENYHGSNNFLLSGKRTKNGRPLLGNDPHLDLTLPSTWYEVQLQCPGLNVYGVSLPGAPGIVIGFNDSLAWGLTNGADDVFDWYRIQFRDSTLAEYFYDGRWVSTRKRVDTVYIRGEEPLYDTSISTHHGPVVLHEPKAGTGRNTPLQHALRWLAHDSSDEIGALLRLQGCATVDCAHRALIGFACPAQNFAVADTKGDIAIFHMGRFPWKWRNQGRMILDGSQADQDWQGWVPWENIPYSVNPDSGYLFSANQEPVDTTYPYHLGSHFTNPDRALRLYRRLRSMRDADFDSAFSIMRDDFGIHAQIVLPTLLAHVDSAQLDNQQLSMLSELGRWDYHYRQASQLPTFFEAWWDDLYQAIWSDDFGGDRRNYTWPNIKVTRNLILNDPRSEWFDDVRTPHPETLNEIVTTSFRNAFRTLRKRLGKESPEWGWAQARKVKVSHLLQLPALGRDNIVTGGCPDCIDAQRESHGPSWRMAVSLTQPPVAYGVYPGGQSGNPGSIHYDDFLPHWGKGGYFPLNRLLTLPPPHDSAYSRLTLDPR